MFTRRPVVFSLLLSALLLSACDDGTTTAEDTHLVDDAETSDTTGASDTNALPDSVSPDGTDATPLQDTDAADVETPPNCGDGVLNAGEFCDDELHCWRRLRPEMCRRAGLGLPLGRELFCALRRWHGRAW